MNRILMIIAWLAPLVPSFEGRANLWINEFHYDNAGSDTGEFVEIAAPSHLTDLASIRLTLYNGGDGTPYGTTHSLGSFAVGLTVDGLTYYSKLIGGLQNGAPDGLALDVGGEVVHFVSYEGTFTASAGPAAGLTSRDVLVFEGEATSPGAALGLTGSGVLQDDFLWTALPSATPGAPNLGQFIVPEPRSPVLLGVFGGLFLWQARRRLRGSRPAPPAPDFAR